MYSRYIRFWFHWCSISPLPQKHSALPCRTVHCPLTRHIDTGCHWRSAEPLHPHTAVPRSFHPLRRSLHPSVQGSLVPPYQKLPEAHLPDRYKRQTRFHPFDIPHSHRWCPVLLPAPAPPQRRCRSTLPYRSCLCPPPASERHCRCVSTTQ